MDRRTSRIRIRPLDDTEPDPYLLAMTPGERVEMVWQLTLDAWAFMGKPIDESGLQRHTVRIHRGGR